MSKTRMGKRVASLLLSLVMMLSLLPTTVYATEDTGGGTGETSGANVEATNTFDEGGTTSDPEAASEDEGGGAANVSEGEGESAVNEFNITAGNVEIAAADGETYTIIGGGTETANTAVVTLTSGTATVVLDNVNVTSDQSIGGVFVANVAAGAVLYLELDGTNVLKNNTTSYGSAAVLQKTGAGKLVICDDNAVAGSLDAEATGKTYGAAIGGSNYSDENGTIGSIEISGGTVTAVASYGAAIGTGGEHSIIDSIVISGGDVTATVSNARYGAAIGGGQYGEVTAIEITGGKVTATAGYGAGVGSGAGSTSTKSIVGTISITNGTVIAESCSGGAGIGGGSGKSATVNSIAISGGTITATSRTYQNTTGAAIGGAKGSVGSIAITAGDVTVQYRSGTIKPGTIGVSAGMAEGSTTIASGVVKNADADNMAQYIGDNEYDPTTGEIKPKATVVKPVSVNGTGYATLEDAIDAATPDANGVITYEISGKVDVTATGWVQVAKAGLTGLTAVKFVGTTDDAEICINGGLAILADQNYDINVSFETLALSKLNPTYGSDYGHSTNYFTTWLRNSGAAENTVTYTNCTFPNGVSNNQYGKTVFDNCKFTNDATGLYNLWNYGGSTEIKNSSFTGTRGIKAYSEGVDGGQIEVADTTFNGLGEKAAIVVSKATTVTLNKVDATECTKGLLQKDIDGGSLETTIEANGTGISGKFDITATTTADAAKNEFNISAGTFTSEVSNDYCADGFAVKANDNGTYGVVNAATAVAKIGDASYETLQAAIDAAAAGETVTLLKDITLEGQQLVIGAGKSFTLDLNGKTLKVSKYTAKAAQVDVLGDLTLTDSSENKTGIICSDYTGTAGLVVCVESGGKLTMNGGTITTDGMANAGNALKIASGATVTMNGGTIKCDAKRGNRAVNITGSKSAGASFIMNGGNVVADGGDGTKTAIYAIIGAYYSTLAISGSSRVSGPDAVDAANSATTISGGTFTGNIKVKAGSISGGTYDKAIDAKYCKDGFILTRNEDGSYGVKAGAYVAQIGDVKYETLKDAINAANTGDTITLLANVDENVEIAKEKNLTLDLNGCTLNGGTGTDKAALSNLGTITIRDTSADKAGTIKRDDNGTVGETSYYVIRNQGTMTIESGNVINNSGYKKANSTGSMVGSSLICNGDCDEGGTLTIKGGTFTQKNFIAIKNGALGVLHVTGGTISSDHSAIQNWFEADITGGEIKGQLWTDAYIKGESVGETTIGGNAKFTGEIVMDIYGSVAPTLAINGGNLSVTNWRITTAAANAGAKPAVSGGTFTSEVPAEYCAAGFIPTANADGTYGVKAGAYAAQIGDVKYETLQAAIDAVKANETIYVLGNVDLGTDKLSTYDVKTTVKNVTIDLGGYTVTSAGKYTVYLKVNGWTIQNGTIQNTNASTTYGTLYVGGSSNSTTLKNLTVESKTNGVQFAIASSKNGIKASITVEDGTKISGNYGVYMKGQPKPWRDTRDGQEILNVNGGEITGTTAAIAVFGAAKGNTKAGVIVNINGGKVYSDSYAIAGNGSSVLENTTINISGGKVFSNKDTAIYHPQAGTVTISGGEVYGVTGGVQMCAGTLNVTGGTISATGNGDVSGKTGDGSIPDGAAVSIVNRAYPAGAPTMTISGGTFTSAAGVGAVQAYGWSSNSQQTWDKPNASISGGTFSSAVPAEYCAGGFIPTDNGDGTYGVKAGAYVAQIGETTYETLAEAFAAAKDGNTITLLRDCESGRINLEDKSVTVNLNGKVLTSTAAYGVMFCAKNGNTITVKGTTAGSKLVGTLMVTAETDGCIEINGGTYESAQYCPIYINGAVSSDNSKLTVNNATITALPGDSDQDNGVAVYLAGYSTSTFTNTTITAPVTGLEIRAGKLTLTDCTVTGGLGEVVTDANGNGTTVTNAAVAISQHTTKKNIDVTITGGTYTAKAAVYQTNVQGTGSENVKVSIKSGTFKGAVSAETNNTVAISGGTFSSAVKEEYCATGYIPTANADGTYGVKEGVYVAKVDNVKYETLQEAINAAKGGSTVRLLANVTLTETAVFPAGKTVHLNLVGHNITATGTALRINGKTDIQDTDKTGIIESTGNVAVAVGNNAKVTVYSGTLKGREGAVITGTSTGATIEIRGSSTKLIATDNAVIAGNGSSRTGNPNTILVKGGTFEGGIVTDGYIACGIYAPWNDNVTVSGGTFNITNGAGIVARAGTVKVTGGTFNCGDGTAKGWVGDSKNMVPCAALVFDKAANYPALTDSSQILVSGGSFSTDPAANGATLTAGYAATKDESGMYKVAKENPAAEINGVKYDTLQAAINAAQATNGGATITLLKNINTQSYYTVNGDNPVTIDLAGYNITGSGISGLFYVTAKGDLTIKGEGTVTAVEDNGAAMAVWVRSPIAKVTLEGGTYTQQITNTADTHFDLIYVEYGTAEIKGGTYEGTTPDWTLNCKDDSYKAGTAHITVTGGTFVGFDPANNKAEGENTSFVPAGYVSTQGADGNYTVEEYKPVEVWTGYTGTKVASYATVAEAAENLGENKWIVIGKDYTLAEDFTIGGENLDNLYLDVAEGATLTVAEGVTLTVAANAKRLGVRDGATLVNKGTIVVCGSSTSNGFAMLYGTFTGNELTVPEGCFLDNNGKNFFATANGNAVYEITFGDGTVKKTADSTNIKGGNVKQIKLLKDVTNGGWTLDSSSVGAEVVLDLNGHTISYNGANRYYATLNVYTKVTIKNGTVKYEGSKRGAIDLVGQGDLTIERDVTIDGGDGFAIFTSGTSKLTVNGKVTANGNYAIAGNGSKDAGGYIDSCDIIVNESASITAPKGIAIYHPEKGTVTINGGTITGHTGIEMCAGQLVVNGGSITSNGDNMDATGSQNAILDGAAISIINRNYPGGVPTAVIKGGTFAANGKDAQTVKAYDYTGDKVAEWTAAGDNVNITGGSFNNIPTNMGVLCAGGYKTVYDADAGLYDVVPANAKVTLTRQLTVSNDLSMTYLAKMPETYTNPYAVFNFYSAVNGWVESTVPGELRTDGRYAFKFTGINPQRMNDTLKITIYATVDGEAQAITAEREDSVVKYCNAYLTQLKNNEDPKYNKWTEIIGNMAEYGAASQKYMNYRMDTLVNGLVTGTTTKDYTDQVESISKFNGVTKVAGGITIKSAKMLLSSSYAMRVYFTLDEGVNPNTVRFTAQVEGNSGEFTEFGTETQNGATRYYFDFSGMTAKQLNSKIMVKSFVNGVENDTLEYSVNMYLAHYIQKPSSDANWNNLVKWLFNYGYACMNY